MTGSVTSVELRQKVSPYLLAIRGTLSPPTLEASRMMHNQTAGDPEGVAAARSLGDLSHLVQVPLERPADGAGEFLILDLWNSIDGLNQFFANPQVQHGGSLMFAQLDPVVWAPSEGLLGYHLPAPHGKSG
jgi:hypothetical protein